MAYIIQKSDVDKAAQILGQSFINYPIFTHIIPDDADRKRKVRYIFRFLVGLGLSNGEVISPSEKIEGVSIWFHSQDSNSSFLTALRAGLLDLYFHVDYGAVSRLIEIGSQKRARRDQLLSQPYCLLDMIGVDPSLQRHGFGRKMIEEKLSELDNDCIPCYLETSRVENINYYNNLGFKLVHDYQLMNVNVFCLLREVRAGKKTGMLPLDGNYQTRQC